MSAKLTVRIPCEELEALRTAAANEKRSVNQQVLYLIKTALEGADGSGRRIAESPLSPHEHDIAEGR